MKWPAAAASWPSMSSPAEMSLWHWLPDFPVQAPVQVHAQVQSSRALHSVWAEILHRRREMGRGSDRGCCLAGSGWTVGVLAWHNWSFAGDADRADVNETFLQPVIAYTTSRAWTFTLQGEDTYTGTGEWWPGQLPSFEDCQGWRAAGQHRWRRALWMDSPDTGPHGFGGRLGMTFLFPAR